MPTQIAQIDLAAPLVPISIEKRYTALWVLVKFGPQPLGWIRCSRRSAGSRVSPDMLARMIADTMPLAVFDVARSGAFEPPPSEGRHRPSMTVAVCTREHPDVLERQLASLAKLDYPDYEVIVVDNAPKTDRTRRVCANFNFVRHILEPRPGLDYARNAAWRNARGEIVAYTDDDARVDPQWLTYLADNYADPSVQCVTGTTYPMELETVAQEHFERYGGMQRGFHRRVYSPGTWNTFFPLGSGRFGAGVNLSVRREMLQRLGGFDLALDVGSIGRGGGDLDIMVRVLRDGGGKLVYEPRAIVWHQHRKTMRQLRRQMFDYGWGFAAYTAKHSSDFELANLSMRMLRQWTRRWGRKRLIDNFKLKAAGKSYFPLHLILLESLGTVLGLRAYSRSVARLASDRILFREKGWSAAA